LGFGFFIKEEKDDDDDVLDPKHLLLSKKPKKKERRGKPPRPDRCFSLLIENHTTNTKGFDDFLLLRLEVLSDLMELIPLSFPFGRDQESLTQPREKVPKLRSSFSDPLWRSPSWRAESVSRIISFPFPLQTFNPNHQSSDHSPKNKIIKGNQEPRNQETTLER
jgi:hypothetical protein